MTERAEITAAGVGRDWSNRLLLAALGGIFFLTFYPFEVVTHAKGIGDASPFLLGPAGKINGIRDIILNILLFVPFGFALGIKVRRHCKSWRAALLYTWLMGILISYGIEFLQLYIPQRDSGWLDVLTNSTGSAAGFVLFMLLGGWLLKALANGERALQTQLTLPRAGVFVLIYFAAWFTASVHLQKETHLGDWINDCRLVIGNDASGWHAWKGHVALLEIWDRALLEAAAKNVMAGGELPPESAPAIKLVFAPAQSGGDGVQASGPSSSTVLPVTGTAGRATTSAGTLPGTTNVAAADIVKRLKQANQFAIRVVLRPAQGKDISGSIASISHASGLRDLYFHQEGNDLTFWFRTPLTERRPALDWTMSRLLRTNRYHDVLLSYDGSEMWVYADGRKPRHDRMGPGSALASYVRHIKQSELNGYGYIYSAIVFLPGGVLLAMVRKGKWWKQPSSLAVLSGAAIAGPAVLEWILMRVNERHFSGANFALSAAMVIGGLLWMKCDAHRPPEDPGTS